MIKSKLNQILVDEIIDEIKLDQVIIDEIKLYQVIIDEIKLIQVIMIRLN